MVPGFVERNLIAADVLCTHAIDAGLNRGCLEVSLNSLGARFTIEDLKRIRQEKTPLDTVLERSGLVPNWAVTYNPLEGNLSLKDVLEGRANLLENAPDGDVAGYLLIERYPNKFCHATAIIPNPPEGYFSIDTIVGGRIQIGEQELGHLLNTIQINDGQILFAQIKHFPETTL